MNIGFLSMEKYENRRENSIGSSRIRGRWMMKYCPEITEFQNGHNYDAVIYQKSYWKEHMELYKGIKIFDICDPDWFENRGITQVAQMVDGFTCTTEAIANYLKQITNKPIKIIPDRIDFDEHYPIKEKHIGRMRSVVWYGYAGNQAVLDIATEVLQQKRLYLVVISDRPYPAASVNVKYEYETVCQEITKHDAVILPNYNKNIKYLYKSNNKTITAWALKMPVIKELEDLDRFMTEEARQTEADTRYKEVRKHYDVRQSGPEYLQFIQHIKEVKSNGRQKR